MSSRTTKFNPAGAGNGAIMSVVTIVPFWRGASELFRYV
jgi:hypothetical protein